MTIESIIGITSGLTAIGGFAWELNKKLKKQPLTELMKQLVDTTKSQKEHRKILRKMKLVDGRIKNKYIDDFDLKDRRIEEVFIDICVNNDIEPTSDVCKKFLGYDSRKSRTEFNSTRTNRVSTGTNDIVSDKSPSSDDDGQIVYMSELLMSRHPETCKRLIGILDKHNTKYAFLKDTNDIWCRDYMPVQIKSGKFIQFKYDPSYLKRSEELEATRSDVHKVCKSNNIHAQFSDINLDGGNVLICDGRAILSDRIFDENPKYDKDTLLKELSKVLECEIIIIPSLRSKEEDFTGHADGMVRFVNRDTILGNRMEGEYQYWQKEMKKVLNTYNLTYIDFPCLTDIKDPKYPDSAVGVYVNYLEVNNLIVLPVFNREEDKVAVETLHKVFPDKQVETIDYNEVAYEGGLLNCTTWVVNR